MENINKKLSSGAAPTPQKVVSEEKPDAEKPSDNIAVQFEEMIKSILDETEKDPRFDDLVESIVCKFRLRVCLVLREFRNSFPQCQTTHPR